MRLEEAPDPGANGEGTLKFFKGNFGFNARETVAILGAHTMGRLHNDISLFAYKWKTKSELLFNNGYYRNMVKKEDWYYPSGISACARLGNAKGERPQARWMPKPRAATASGAPIQWLQEKLICPVPSDATLESQTEVPSCDEKNLQWLLVSGKDETMLPADIGMYYDFQVDDNSIPTGCPGFEHFNMESWGGFKPYPGFLRNYGYTWTQIDGKYADPGCPYNKMSDPPGTTPMHQIVEEYANDNAKFLSDFMRAMEKMLVNGYHPDDLQEAPLEGMAGWKDVPLLHLRCVDCYVPNGKGKCVAMRDSTYLCSNACVANPRSYHCPAGSPCWGHICMDDPGETIVIIYE